MTFGVVAVVALSVGVNTPQFGPLGVDVVSAATTSTPAPAPKPAPTPAPKPAPSKVTTPAKTTTAPVKKTTTNTITNNAPITKVLRRGSTGVQVKNLQTLLNANGYNLSVDGSFGPLTLASVKNYQGANGLLVDGSVGPLTRAKILASVKEGNTSLIITQVLRKGSTGAQVRNLQTLLNSNGFTLVVDGSFGPLTLSAVKNFQGLNGLVIDGSVGPITSAKLLALKAPVAPITPPIAPVTPVTPPVDVVTSASIVNTAATFENAISKDGKWIIATLNDLTFTKELVLDGEFKNGKKDADGNDVIQRKIAPYTQDDKKVVIDRFTITAPKLTIKSPNARIQSGTFRGDLYVSSANFQLVDAKVEGNVYFTTQEAKDTFKIDAKSSVTGKQILADVDAVSTASIVSAEAAFENAISKNGKWIAATLKDLTFENALVLDGVFVTGKKDADGNDIVRRKIAPYTQDASKAVTRKFTITAPKLTIKSPNAVIQSGIFKGDIYVASEGFQLVDTKVEGNVYFYTQEAKDTFKMDAKSEVTGKQEFLAVDAVTTASIVNTAAAFEQAISKDGKWIIATLNDLTFDKELVLEGEFTHRDVLNRKIAPYTQDEKKVVTRKFTLTAPKLTILSPNAKIQSGIFKGDLYVSGSNFQLIDAKVEGNVYFTTQEAKDTFKMDASSQVTGVQELKIN